MKCSCKAENKMVKKSAFKQIYTIISLLFLLSLWPLFLGGIGCIKFCFKCIQFSRPSQISPYFLSMTFLCLTLLLVTSGAQKITSMHKKGSFPLKGFFSKYGQIRREVRNWSHLLKKSLMENFIFYRVHKNYFYAML